MWIRRTADTGFMGMRMGRNLRIGAPGAFCDHLGNGKENPLVIPISEDGKLGIKRLIVMMDMYMKTFFGKKQWKETLCWMRYCQRECTHEYKNFMKEMKNGGNRHYYSGI